MNRFQFIGHVGADATVRALDSGATAISFSVAITEKYKDKADNQQEQTTWVGCTLWRNQGQSTAIAQYLKKGQKVLVEGKPSARAYQTKDGQNAASIEVRVDNVELIGATPGTQAYHHNKAGEQQRGPGAVVTGDPFANIPDLKTDDKDLPF